MDWTFWVGLVVIAVIWFVTWRAFSLRRRRENVRREDREVADAAEAVRRAKEHPDLFGGGMP